MTVHVRSLASVLAIPAFVSVSCAGAPPAAPALEPAPLDCPAGAASSEPQVTSSERGVVLSWLENAGSDTRLVFAERAHGTWSDARVVVARGDFFANWADLPSVTKLHDG